VEPELKFKPRFRPRHLKSFRPCWAWFWPANPGFDPAPQPWFWPALQNSRRCCCVTDKFYAMKYIGVFEPQFLFLKWGKWGVWPPISFFEIGGSGVFDRPISSFLKLEVFTLPPISKNFNQANKGNTFQDYCYKITWTRAFVSPNSHQAQHGFLSQVVERSLTSEDTSVRRNDRPSSLNMSSTDGFIPNRWVSIFDSKDSTTVGFGRVRSESLRWGRGQGGTIAPRDFFKNVC